MRLAACGVLIVLANRCNTTVAVEMAANSRSVLDRLDSDRLDFGTLTLDLEWLVVETSHLRCSSCSVFCIVNKDYVDNPAIEKEFSSSFSYYIFRQ